MVQRLCSSICLLMLGLIACPSMAADQGGFIFRNQQSKATSPAARYYQDVVPYAAQAQRIEMAAKPAVKDNNGSRSEVKKPAKVTASDSHDMLDEYRADSCCDDYGCGDACCDSTCCDSTCCDCGSCSIGFDCCGERDFIRSGKFFIRGWVDQGFTYNAQSPANRANGPVGYNWRSNDYMMNQLYAIIGRDVCANGCYWDAGGRVDLLYGTDYRYTQAWGLETHAFGTPRWNPNTPAGRQAMYGFSMPQLYAEFAVPAAQGTTVKVGHFYSLIGYESPMAPQNFFYSHSYAKVYGEPETETGMLASSKLGSGLVLHGGFSRGWNMWENPYNTISFIGGACWTSPDDRTSLGFAIDSGDLEPNSNRTVLSLVLSRELGRRWMYVFQFDFGSQQDAFRNQQAQLQKADWYAIDNYLFYTISDTLSAGLRVEWFHDPQRYIVFNSEGNPALSGSDYYEITLGLNWQPTPCVIVRPELRWDWSNVRGSSLFPFRPYNDFTSSHQFLLATDVIIRF